MCKTLKSNVKKYLELKEEIAVLEAELKEVSNKIMTGLDKEGLKSFELDDNKVTKITATRIYYSETIIPFLKEKAPVCIVETFDKDKLKACITAGILNEKDIAQYESFSTSSYIKFSKFTKKK